jgi:hypothetical protein
LLKKHSLTNLDEAVKDPVGFLTGYVKNKLKNSSYSSEVKETVAQLN